MYDITDKIIEELKTTFKMKPQGEYLYGECPECGEKSLWAGLKNPYYIQCNRHNNCSFAGNAKELFPDLYGDLNKKYPATKEAPNQTADVYLSAVRGFNLGKISGWYEQAKYWHPHGDKGTATVRFYLSQDKLIFWERLIDDVTITDENGKKETRNKNFKGSFKGIWWQPPGFTIEADDEIYLVEGIFDAIALNLSGFKAVSMMSSVSLPLATIKQHTGKNVTWVLALDNDEAGLKFLHRHAELLRKNNEKVTAALTSESTEKQDWNDLFKSGKLKQADMDKYRHNGKVELSQSRYEKARHIWEFNKKQKEFVFEFENTTYTCKLNKQKFDEIRSQTMDPREDKQETATEKAFDAAANIQVCATFVMKFLYFQEPEAGDDGQYYLRLRFPNASPDAKKAFTNSAFSSSAEFKKAALKTPGAQFTGTTKDLDYLYRRWTETPAKKVRSIDYVGYDKTVNAYIYNDFAVEKGRVIKLNKDDYFQLEKTGIKSVFDGKQTLSTNPPVPFLDDYLTAYGVAGLIAMAWWLGSLFAEQIRHDYANYPFLEIIGDSGSGKSQMVDVLSKLIGKDSDVFNPNFGTQVGKTRRLAGVSNLPVIFNETDNENEGDRLHVKKFSWDEHKDLYEGRIGRVSGVKTNDNNVREPMFKGALMIVQNIPVHASEAILSRIIHLQFDRTHHSFLGKQAADRLMKLSISDLSGFLLQTLRKETDILRCFKKQHEAHSKRLRENSAIRTQRIIDNHSKLMALIDCLSIALPIPTETAIAAHKKAQEMAVEREAVLRRDHPIVEQFWYLYDFMNSRVDGNILVEDLINHSDKDGEIAINLEHFRQQCAVYKLEMIESRDLRKYLPGSTSPKFKASNQSVWSRIERKTMKCWIFTR